MSANSFKQKGILWLCLIWPLLAASSLLINDRNLVIASALTAAVPVSVAADRYLRGRNEQAKLSQYQSLLAALASRVASGQTMEHALSEAALSLAAELGPRNGLVRALTQLRRRLQARMQTQAIMAGLSDYFGLSRVRSQLEVLAPLNRHGGRLDVFLRRSHDALSKERRMQAEVAAARSQTSSETLVLLALPFILAATMGSGYRTDLAAVPWRHAAGLLVYAIAIGAIIAALLILSPEREDKRQNVSTERVKKPASPARFWRYIYLTVLPGNLGHRLKRSAIHINGHEHGFDAHLSRKSSILLCSAPLAGFFAYAGLISVFAVLPAAMLPLFLHDLDLLRKESARLESYRLELPVFLNLLVVLLESGLTLDTALACIPPGSDRKEPFMFGPVMRKSRQKLALGMTADAVLAEMADACPVPDLAASLNLAARYARQGGAEIISLLTDAAADSWQEYRLALQRKLERRTLLLMIPMGLDLLAVILTAVLPAIASFSTF